MFVELFDLCVDAAEDRIGVVALLQEHNAFYCVGIVNDFAVFAMCGATDLAEANLGALRNGCNVFDLDGRAVRGLDDGILNILNTGEEAGGLHVNLLRALLDEAAAAVGVVAGDLLLDLGDAQSIGDELLRIELDLIFLGGSAEAGNIDHPLDALERFFQRPVFQ